MTIIFLKCIVLATYFQFHSVTSSLDLFVDRTEAKNLLGIESQIWYVKNGVIESSALSYAIKVPTEKNVVTFHWQNRQMTIMPYTLEVSVTNKNALLYPRLYNIQNKGVIPNSLVKWRILLNCTGNVTTQAHVNITLQVPLTHSLKNMSTLIIQRQKICFKTERAKVSVDPFEEDKSNNIVYILLGFLTAFGLCAFSVIGMHFFKRKKQRNHFIFRQPNPGSLHLEDTETSGLKTTDVSMSDICQSPHSIGSVLGVHHPVSNQYYLDARDGDINSRIKQLNINKDRVQLQQLQLEGTFGRVYNGKLMMKDTSTQLNVMVKTMTAASTDVQKSVMLSEGLMLAGLSHENLLSVLAVVLGGNDPPQIIFGCNNQVNLKRYLQGTLTILSRDVVCMASQVLNGLSYMHNKFLVHKDVASRNCVVDESLHLKLCDSSLSRDIFPEDYQCLGDNNNRPIKWLAIESLDHKVYSPSSDVWSWGVLLWELMTLGQQPYNEIDPIEMLVVLRKGMRLAQPINCPDELFNAMTYCWNDNPQQRPTPGELVIYLEKFLQHLDSFV